MQVNFIYANHHKSAILQERDLEAKYTIGLIDFFSVAMGTILVRAVR